MVTLLSSTAKSIREAVSRKIYFYFYLRICRGKENPQINHERRVYPLTFGIKIILKRRTIPVLEHEDILLW